VTLPQPLEEIVFPLIVILSPAINVACFVSKFVSNCPIFVATLVVPYNKLVPAFIVVAEKME
jgi:hypothetical protein